MVNWTSFNLELCWDKTRNLITPPLITGLQQLLSLSINVSFIFMINWWMILLMKCHKSKETSVMSHSSRWCIKILINHQFKYNDFIVIYNKNKSLHMSWNQCMFANLAWKINELHFFINETACCYLLGDIATRTIKKNKMMQHSNINKSLSQ